MIRPATTVLAALLLLAAVASADSVFLNTGKCLRGKIVAEHPDHVVIELLSGETRKIPRSEITMIRKGSSAVEEYKKRLKALADDDLRGFLDLADWCKENKLRRQKTQALRKAIGVKPDCAEARRALSEIWDGQQWIRDRKKGEAGEVRLGPAVSCEPLRVKVQPPAGWVQEKTGGDRLRFRGPARYRRAVVLEFVASTDGTTCGYAKEKGWSSPAPFGFGPAKGSLSEQKRDEESNRITVREYRLEGGGLSCVARLEALGCEIDDWTPHLKQLLGRLEVLEPKLDFRAPAIGIGFCHEKVGWQVQGGGEGEDESPGVTLLHAGDALEFATINYTQIQVASEEASGEEEMPLEKLGELLLTVFGGQGDVISKSESRLGVAKGSLWVVDDLKGGIPYRNLYIAAVHGQTVHVLFLSCHERSIDRFRPAFEKVRTTFTFGVK